MLGSILNGLITVVSLPVAAVEFGVDTVTGGALSDSDIPMPSEIMGVAGAIIEDMLDGS